MDFQSKARSTALRLSRAQGSGSRRHRVRHLRLVSDLRAARGLRDARARVLVTGGPRVGKTTFIGAVSEAAATALPAQILSPLLGRASPTDPIDLGRLTIASDPVVELRLIGTTSHRRCWPVWDVLRRDPATLVGAVLLTDMRRVQDCLPALEYFDRFQVPYLLAVNHLDPASRHSAEHLRALLGVGRTVPVVAGDARRPADARNALVRLVEHSLRSPQPRPWNQGGERGGAG
jgi:signal recognition particle receptor subunit beta